MDANDWAALGIAFTVLMFWVGALHKRLSQVTNLSERYVPRPQIDSRFASIEKRWERELETMERHAEKQFDQVNTKLDRILNTLDSKADK